MSNFELIGAIQEVLSYLSHCHTAAVQVPDSDVVALQDELERLQRDTTEIEQVYIYVCE